MTVGELKKILNNYLDPTEVTIGCLETYDGVSVWRVAAIDDVEEGLDSTSIVIYPEEE